VHWSLHDLLPAPQLKSPCPAPCRPAPAWPGPAGPASQVSQHDAESLSWVTLLPKELRARVLALRAFHLEALLIGEAVRSKERAMAAIRWAGRGGAPGGRQQPPPPAAAAARDWRQQGGEAGVS
jgi:hypothetical protein